jgi:acetyl esterase/lipase
MQHLRGEMDAEKQWVSGNLLNTLPLVHALLPNGIGIPRATAYTRPVKYHFAPLVAASLLLSVALPARAAEPAKTEKKKPAPVKKAEPKPLVPAFPNVRIEENIEYLEPGRTEKADLYLPTDVPKDQRCPAILIIHGGGWSGGIKNAAREQNIGNAMANRGYVCMSIDYVLAKAGNPPAWPQNLYDCKTAVRWLRKNAERLQIDPEHIGVIGGSAGGHLSAMVGLTHAKDGLDPKGPYGEFPCHVQCAVDLYGPADLMTWHDISAFGKTRAQDPDVYKLASPTTHADKNDPPMLVMHGTADATVDLHQSELMVEALKAAGVEHQFVIVKDAPHTFHLQPKQQDLRPIVFAFFDKYLRPAKK